MFVQDHYVVNEKFTLRQGDLFRAKAGPYYIARDEKGGKRRVPMAAKGPFKFFRYCEASKRKWIEAWSVKEGSIAILSLNGRRSLMPGALIPRPYHITGRVSAKKAIKIAAKLAMKGKRPRSAKGHETPAKPATDTRQAAVDSVLAGLLPIAPFGG
jgi:hypothetical protein